MTVIQIPSENLHPVAEPRYRLGDAAITTLHQLRNRGSSKPLDFREEATRRAVAETVFASSEIEGEGFGAENLEPFVAALTEPGERVDAELRDRLSCFEDQVRTYFWAAEYEGAITPDFILEVHWRLFNKTKPEIAGILKEREVVISYRRNGEDFQIETIPAARSADFLEALCARARPLTIEAAGEFQCDFLAIHPFADGNGRTARLLASILLERAGHNFTAIYPLDQVILENRSAYYDALLDSQKSWHLEQEDLTPWMEFFIDAVQEQAERAKRRLGNKR